MVKQEVKALEGFEQEFELISAKKANLEEEKRCEIEKAIAEVEEKFVVRAKKLDEVLADVSEIVEIEIPDEEIKAEDVIAEEPIEAVAVEEQPVFEEE